MIFRIGASLSIRSFALIARKTAANARPRKVPPSGPRRESRTQLGGRLLEGSGVQILRLRFLCGSDILGSLCDLRYHKVAGLPFTARRITRRSRLQTVPCLERRWAQGSLVDNLLISHTGAVLREKTGSHVFSWFCGGSTAIYTGPSSPSKTEPTLTADL